MTCKIFGTGINDQKCETCLDEYYFLEGTQNCFDEAPEGYYLDNDEKKYKKCYESCKTCTNKKEINNHNCVLCKPNYTLFKNKNCLNCKSLNKYVNYAQTECIDEVPDGYYVNNEELNTIDKCHPNCLTCKSKGTDYDMKCTSCDNDNAYFFFFGTNNCQKMPLPGYYIDKDDKKIKKCDEACATCTYRPLYNELNEVTNCDTCNKDLGFYNKEPGSTICINKTKEGEYYDESCKCYKKCHENCLTCSGAAIDEYHMNCLTCDTKKGFEYFKSTTNCLNCKSLNKKVNYDQTECIDDVPDGLYINDTDTNTIDYCHENCLICLKSPITGNNNCLLCKLGLYLDNGNCVKNYNCPYKFYYKANIDKNAYSTEKVCLKKDEMCPSSLPFYYTSTNECVQSCPLDLLLFQGCKISNYYYGIKYFILSIKINFIQGLLSALSRTSFYIFNNIYLKISILNMPCICNINYNYRNLRSLESEENTLSKYQSLIDDNLTQIETTNKFEGSDIYLGDCENKLREYYNIPDEVDLTLIKIDYRRNDSKLNNVQYEVFNPKNRSEKLDLSICQKEKIKVTNPIDISSFRIGNLIEDSNDNLQFSDISDKFYNDMCYSFLSEHGAYVLLQDRILDYNYESQYCQEGCTIQDVNVTSSTVSCLCPPNKGFENINLENIYNNIIKKENENVNSETETSGDKYNTQKYSLTNIKALKCIKNVFTSEFIKNYILIIFSLLLISYLILVIKCLVSYSKYKKTFKISIVKCNPPKNQENKENKEKTETKDKKEKKKEKSGKKEKSEKKKDKKIQKFQGKIMANSEDPFKKSLHNGENDEKPKEKNERDLDNKSLETAREHYKNNKNESFLQMFLYSLKKREIIFSFLNKIDNSLILKIILLILSFINYFAVNTCFFSEKTVHQIYVDRNVYNFSYQFKYIMSSLLISYVFFAIAKYFYNFESKISIIPNKIQLLVSFIVSSIIFIFYWMYIGAVTSLYININKHLIINIILCFIFSIILKALLSLIYAACRILAIKTNKEFLYNISKKINYI